MQLSVEPTSTTEPRRVHLPTLESWLSSVAARRDSLGWNWATAVPARTCPTAQAAPVDHSPRNLQN